MNMDSFEWNKVFGAILATLLVVMVIREVGGFIFYAEELDEPGYRVELPDPVTPENGGEEPEPALDLGALLVEANAGAGERIANQCVACHNFEKGGANMVGPALWGVLGREIAALDGFNYSRALASKDGVWDYESMYKFLENPREWAPGTLMGYAGLRRQRDRVNLLAWMQQKADTPYPFPAALAADGDGAQAEPAAEEPAAPQSEAPQSEAGEAEAGNAAPEEPAEPAPADEPAQTGDEASTEDEPGDDEATGDEPAGDESVEDGEPATQEY